jgi:molecular chaperone GrpE
LIFDPRNLISPATLKPTEQAEMAEETAPETPAAKTAGETAAEPSTGFSIDGLMNEVSEMKDKVLRTLAEMENLRRRTEREIADTRQYAVSSFAREILTVGDNLRRALDAVPEESRKSAEAVWSSLLDGVELTERELLKVLGKHGVKVVEPAGQRFDPNLHQAMFEVADPTLPAGTIVNVIQPGYMIGERVLRPAMVSVAKGGPKAPRPTADTTALGKDAE